MMSDKRLAEIKARCEAATDRRPIPGYAGYEADDNGYIWSVETNWRGYGVRRLVEEIDRHGYSRVRLYRDGRRVRKQVHRLVALAFYGEPGEGEEVRHLDGDRANNRPCNLRWGTGLENAHDRERHGHTARGSRNGAAKLTENKVREIKRCLSLGHPQRQIARQFGVSQRAVGSINRRERWTHVHD
jgi:hypothetical protein